jgi:glycosyltransferase involved in cell wall biosynthesis
MRATVVIPCWNEAPNLPALVARCTEAAHDAGGGLSFLLVDNGSTDGTREILPSVLAGRTAIEQLRLDGNLGYGGGILAGLQVAAGRGDDVLGWTHADLQCDPLALVAALQSAREAPDPGRVFVKGVRHGRPPFDVAWSVSMAALHSTVLRCPLWEINAQPTLFSRALWPALEGGPRDFRLDLFAYAVAVRWGWEVRRVGVTFPPRRAGVGSNDRFAQKVRTARRLLAGTREVARWIRAVPPSKGP